MDIVNIEGLEFTINKTPKSAFISHIANKCNQSHVLLKNAKNIKNKLKMMGYTEIWLSAINQKVQDYYTKCGFVTTKGRIMRMVIE